MSLVQEVLYLVIQEVTIWMYGSKNFQPERSYKFLFKVVSGSEGSFIETRNQEIIDRNYEFIIQEALFKCLYERRVRK